MILQFIQKINGPFVEKWQTLIGSALGPFLAIIFSIIGFWTKQKFENYKERKESHRQIEISMAKALNDTFIVIEQLKWFLDRIKVLITDIKNENDNKTFFLNRINFPTIREIYRDSRLAELKTKSYYLHNKLMWIESGIKHTNETLLNLKKDFEDLIRLNEMLISLMKNNPDPQTQKKSYERSLGSFAETITEYVNKSIHPSLKILMQVKTYNEKLRGRCGFWRLWRYESTKFKFFKNKNDQKAFANNLGSLDRIDKKIENEVQLTLKKAEERYQKYVNN